MLPDNKTLRIYSKGLKSYYQTFSLLFSLLHINARKDIYNFLKNNFFQKKFTLCSAIFLCIEKIIIFAAKKHYK